MSVRHLSLTLLALLSCAREAPAPVPPIPADPQRIVSLGPSLTNIVWSVGAGPRLVGRSRWDDVPSEVVQVADVGEALRPNVERIVASRPDLVLLYRSPDNVDAEQALHRAGIPVVSLRIDSIEEFLAALDSLSGLVGAGERGDSLALALRRELRDVADRIGGYRRRPAVFLPVWDRPLMTLGSGSFLSELVGIAGGRNVFGDTIASSLTVSMEEVMRRDPDVILAGPATVTRIAADRRWQGLRAVREQRVLAYDTLLVSQPTIRMGEAARTLATLINGPERP